MSNASTIRSSLLPALLGLLVAACSAAGTPAPSGAPTALPNLFTGIRLGLSQAWLFVVVAHIFGATKGLGFRLTDSQLLTRVDLMLVAMLVLAVLGKMTDTMVVALQRRALGWRDTLESEAGR
jgi:sulfonate transport system permease protein